MSSLINLLPWRAQARQRRLRFLAGITVSASLLLVSFLGAGKSILSQKRVLLQTEARALEIELNRIRALLQDNQSEENKNRQRLRPLQNSALQIARWADLLPAVSRALPPGSWLSNLSWQAGVLTIEGYSSTLTDIEHIESGLRAIYPDFHVKPGLVSCDSKRGLAYAFFMKKAGE